MKQQVNPVKKKKKYLGWKFKYAGWIGKNWKKNINNVKIGRGGERRNVKKKDNEKLHDIKKFLKQLTDWRSRVWMQVCNKCKREKTTVCTVLVIFFSSMDRSWKDK